MHGHARCPLVQAGTASLEGNDRRIDDTVLQSLDGNAPCPNIERASGPTFPLVTKMTNIPVMCLLCSILVC